MYEYRAKVTEVYDGDTITAIADLGFHINIELKIRLFGIDTPEIRGEERDAGLISRDRLRELILGKDIVVKTYRDKQEKYGRWLGEIFLLDNPNTSVNRILINEGLAKEYLL